MPNDNWSAVATFADPISAQALAGRLTSEELPCQVVSNESIPGLATEFAVLVPAELLQRAQWILEQAHFSEEELTYLATGEVPEAAND
ncbi:MAG: DUF2007 domain-containing protein [Proteobacteria bacterium]|nr:DUF2007 domain-containing protein [Pseudomonadota bacterium]